ncbi:hypothetical protein OCU04_012777 [Sclerotinia nivalis]|uniref:Uncharacterized protein n=1 Tax=Sclerotinia nivalis TaxID=352851 RepID=A0A9X0A996_9HELO|nr:hypothetical protein OCU04_012777 [Sclerotinia nivalis]
MKSSHGHERIWFYYVYNLAWELDGPDQTSLLPIPKTTENQINATKETNRGSLPRGQLNFPEFMVRMTDGEKQKCEIQLNGKDLDGTARQLCDAKFCRNISARIIADTVPGTLDGKTIPYIQMVQNLMGVVTKAHQKIPSNPDVVDTVKKMVELVNTIVRIREAAFSQGKWLGKDIADAFGLPEDEGKQPTSIIYVDIPDPNEHPATGKTVQRVDVQATFDDTRNNALIKEAFERKRATSDDTLKNTPIKEGLEWETESWNKFKT